MKTSQKSSSLLAAIIALLITSTLPACSDTSSTTALEDLEEWDLVWITDSNGMNVFDIYAQMIEEDTGKTVNVHDSFVSFLDAGEVQSALKTGDSTNFKLSKLVDWIPEAEVIVFWAQPSEFFEINNPFDWKCSGTVPSYVDSCDSSDLANYSETLTEIYQLIFDLRDGQPTIIRTIDGFGNNINHWKSLGVYEECRQCTNYVVDVVRQTASDFNIPVAPVLEAFSGNNWGEDPSDRGYISDGVHPNDLGAEVIAQVLRELGYDPVIP